MAQLVQLSGAAVGVQWRSQATSDASLTLTEPSGAASSPAVDNASSPVHKATLTPTVPGQYKLLWATVGGERFADVLDVWPAEPR
jgi:hypothetical protein